MFRAPTKNGTERYEVAALRMSSWMRETGEKRGATCAATFRLSDMRVARRLSHVPLPGQVNVGVLPHLGGAAATYLPLSTSQLA